jgi:hypothetical protein
VFLCASAPEKDAGPDTTPSASRLSSGTVPVSAEIAQEEHQQLLETDPLAYMVYRNSPAFFEEIWNFITAGLSRRALATILYAGRQLVLAKVGLIACKSSRIT